jgi:hypothetical protein
VGVAEEKLLAIGIWLIIVASPFFYWLVLYIANPRSPEDLKSQIKRVKRLRWITYVAAIAFWLFCLVDHLPNHYWVFGTGVLTASLGFVFPDGWLKNRLARSEQPTSSSPNSILHLG